MKRFFILFFIVITIFCFSACGDKVDITTTVAGISGGVTATRAETQNGTTTSSSEINAPAELSDFEKTLFDKTLGGDENFKGYDKLTDAEKSAIIEQADSEGLDVSFEDDVMIVEDEEGEMQYGNIKVNDDLIFGMIPNPHFGLITMKGSTGEGAYVLLVAGVTAEQVNGYVDVLKKAGYKKDAIIDDGTEDGVYLFSAQNAEGDFIDVSFSRGMMLVNCEKLS